jgi:hypothetical protein
MLVEINLWHTVIGAGLHCIWDLSLKGTLCLQATRI